MKSKPEIPDEEIRSLMDFDQLIRNHENLIVKKNKFNFLNKILIASFAVITGSVMWYYYNVNENNNTDEMQPINEVIPAQPSDDSQNSNRLDNQVDQTINPSQTDDGSESKLIPDQKKTKTSASPEERTQPILAQEEQQAEVEYNFIEAEPVDGYPYLYEYFNRELKYPDEGLRDSIQGVVTVSLVISETGQAEKIEIRNSLGEAFDREVKKVIENMPAWKPATVNGKPVSSRLSMPLTFQIKKIKRTENP